MGGGNTMFEGGCLQGGSALNQGKKEREYALTSIIFRGGGKKLS